MPVVAVGVDGDVVASQGRKTFSFKTFTRRFVGLYEINCTLFSTLV